MTEHATSAPRTARERARAELTAEIKNVARQHLASSGAAALSLRAVTRELGMASSAIYRYFESRDALLTALIVDAYNSIGEAAEKADASSPRGDIGRRWLDVCRSIRGWAVENRHEYALIYGSPVPGYVAPQDTTAAAARVTLVLLSILADAVDGGTAPTLRKGPIPKALRPDLAVLTDVSGANIPPDVQLRGLAAWTQVFGMISFELFGHFTNVIEETSLHFDTQCKRIAVELGLT